MPRRRPGGRRFVSQRDGGVAMIGGCPAEFWDGRAGQMRFVEAGKGVGYNGAVSADPRKERGPLSVSLLICSHGE